MHRKHPRYSTSETKGEALLNFESKAILVTKTGDLRDHFVLSERPGAIDSLCCTLAHILKATWDVVALK
ncbi:hypothetical protein KBY75_11030 [Cyanobium sp. T1G-Tous]|uniref:hypothetical protein n=1 Tax=Cyanobium sp. T1G-Tous TaxID=2823722 RepID=UPI0020CC8BDC|nr:hypothetical protein [Cyanobium sp. T1G-Tous]MCP9804100.1 hypothetical protein [Cyanobium sp. T1G-Tous]